ncbi:MAG: hypothetical protein WCF36_10205 [Candidatus Nanopelagicales bacterium]
MGTVVLGWDVDRGTRWVPPYDHALTQSTLSGEVTAPWHLGVGRVPAPGTVVHLMLQGHTRGLVGRGIVRSAPFVAGATDHPGTVGTHVLVEWDRLLPIDQRIGCERLAGQIPEMNWAGVYTDVLEVPDEIGARLDQLWEHPHAGLVDLASRWATWPLDGARALLTQVTRTLPTAHR